MTKHLTIDEAKDLTVGNLERNRFHVYVEKWPRHESYPSCWCRPVMIYRDPVTLSEVWEHRELSV